MKPRRLFPFILSCVLLLGSVTITNSSCNRDAHCPANKQLKKDAKRDLSKSFKGGKSGLMPKKKRRRR